jgi:hypothetical protein
MTVLKRLCRGSQCSVAQAAVATKCRAVTPNICGVSVSNKLHDSPYDAWNFKLAARLIGKSVHAPLILGFLGLDLRGNWVSRISKQQFPQIRQRSPFTPVQFCNYSAVLK